MALSATRVADLPENLWSAALDEIQRIPEPMWMRADTEGSIGYLASVPPAPKRERLPLTSRNAAELYPAIYAVTSWVAERLPGDLLPSFGGVLSRMLPGAHMVRHRDPGLSEMTVTVALKVPEGCVFTIGSGDAASDEKVQMAAGEVWTWPHSSFHGVMNDSSETRYVLLLRYRPPLLTC